MFQCKFVSTPVEAGKLVHQDDSSVDKTMYRQMVGCLRYICNTRPDIVYVVGLISRFMEAPTREHLLAAKRLFRYIKGTIDFGLLLPNHFSNPSYDVIGFSDADWCGDKLDRKSTTWYLFMLGNSPISWCSKKHDVVALSSCEAEYIAACMASCQSLWLDTLLLELKLKRRR
ncbi:PREDICTED: uncharacterized protein LOC109344628 [Lupinus angustifolius]|uniref:uncharacterized protein LOC109344628 n=1 Tax=Lupinus angustifolius TaxID=3871 RepID=UPI00092EB2D9|nr:PREDICTED: uncharacterized protein LOC109344628 [Lupinus angustifolius]